jgi:uncharacterized membrane protein YraQ (UPF0718 family)/YHS domain-containing protein
VYPGGDAVTVLHGLGHGLDEAFFMFWETLWALVLGFALSGAVQAFVSRREMRSALGDHRPATLAKASFFGVVSSSCSYAASALAKTLFSRGADFTAALVFMVASTNLVVELGIVLWLLIGWQFALAEFVGGALMIAALGVLVPRLIPARWTDEARSRLVTAGDDGPSEDLAAEPWGVRVRSRAGWTDASRYTVSDLTMLRSELLIGFAVAGFLSALVPDGFWRSMFWTGHGLASSVENVVLGPFLAIISFVCSVGNVPLAAALWKGGIGFGGVVSFVFADLITLPLLAIYRRYYGTRTTVRMLGVLWMTMSLAGLAVEYLFRTVGIADPTRPRVVSPTGFRWDSTTWLNIAALLVFAVLYRLHRSRPADGGRYARDPVCGMQVEVAFAPASLRAGGERHYFCSDHCAERFTAAAATGGTGAREPADPTVQLATDPICGMELDLDSPLRSPDGHVFCGEGCRSAYLSGQAHAGH